MLKWRIKRCKWATDVRRRFPAGEYLGERFTYCNHKSTDSFAIQLRLVITDSLMLPYPIVTPWFPSCCAHLHWAQALFFLATHRMLRDHIPDLLLRREAFELLKKKVEPYGIAMPPMASFWDFRNARNADRKRRTEDRLQERRRYERVERFLATVGSQKDRIQDFLLVLGFEVVPSMKELRSRFLELASIHHPDAGGNVREFRSIREAYELAIVYLKSD